MFNRINIKSYSYTYHFQFYATGTVCPSLPGVYTFLRKNFDTYDVVYIGEAQNLNDRLNTNFEQHHQYYCITRNKATHLAYLIVNGDRQKRLDIETELRNYYHPTFCNQQ